MGVLGDDGIAVLIGRVQVDRVELVLPAERRAGVFLAADGLFLKRDLHAVPVLERDADPAGDHVAAAAHPVRALAADPDELPSPSGR